MHVSLFTMEWEPFEILHSSGAAIGMASCISIWNCPKSLWHNVSGDSFHPLKEYFVVWKGQVGTNLCWSGVGGEWQEYTNLALLFWCENISRV